MRIILYERLRFTSLLFIFQAYSSSMRTKEPLNTEMGTFHDKNTLYNTVEEP